MAEQLNITPGQVKLENKKLIYKYIYDKKKVSQQDICYDLRISRPTVTTNLNQLEEEGLITKVGQIDSDLVGRKANGYGIVSDFKVAIGVEIVRKEIKMMAMDLYGERIERVAVPLVFENSDTYFRTVSLKILEFITDLKLEESQILGIGFSMQSLVSPDGTSIIYGQILDCTGLNIDVFTKYLPYPCRFIHDADSAAISELWVNKGLNDAFYLSISKHVAGAIIKDRRILSGLHGHSATFEHIPMLTRRNANVIKESGAVDVIKGKKCYCGKYGCVDTICSLEELLLDNEELDDFFEKKNSNDKDILARWDIFLTDLAEVINMLHMIYDTDFILGGYLAPYLTDDDLAFIYKEIHELTPFEESDDFLHISQMPKHSITVGGALMFIEEFLSEDVIK